MELLKLSATPDGETRSPGLEICRAARMTDTPEAKVCFSEQDS